MYREPHLTEKNSKCNKLWYDWFELFNNPETKNTKKCRDLRKRWSKCVHELGVLLTEDAKTNPRYKNLNGYRSSVKD